MQNNWIKILLSAVFFGVGIILIAISCIIRHINMGKKKRCTAQTYGIVCKWEMRRGIHSSIREDVPLTMWVPTYEYAVNQHVIKRKSTVGYSKKYIEEGQIVSIYYDPEDPTCIYVPNNQTKKIHMILCGIGIAFLCVGIGVCLLITQH